MVNINHMVIIQIQVYGRIEGCDIDEKNIIYYSNYYNSSFDCIINIFLLSPLGLPNKLFFKTWDRPKPSL